MKWSIGGRVPFTRSIEQASKWADDGSIYSCNSDTPALASFTSGSTGEPKAAIRTHGFLLAQHRAIEDEFRTGTWRGRTGDAANLRAGESCLTCYQYHRRCRSSTSFGDRAAARRGPNPRSSGHASRRVTRIPRADCRLLRTTGSTPELVAENLDRWRAGSAAIARSTPAIRAASGDHGGLRGDRGGTDQHGLDSRNGS